MTLRQHYESTTGLKATWRGFDRDYHMPHYVQWLERRLEEEIKHGHRLCKPDDCCSSGTDCPAQVNAATPGKG